ncbi:MAG: hypothetical protein KPEEDBHJ_02829 [Anaerolineales bacterium]|nr:hypothetical protein [Anaerolineales bacterium]
MQSNPVPAVGQKSNRNMILYIALGVLLFCCCISVAVGGYYAYKAYVAAQQVVEDVQNFDIPTDVPFNPLDPNATPVPGFDTTGDAPSGGLADKNTRLMAWAAVQLVGMMSGCEMPTVEGTAITVTQQPDANGVWREEWNVNCGNGTFKTFPLVFTPQDGFVNVEVEFQP